MTDQYDKLKERSPDLYNLCIEMSSALAHNYELSFDKSADLEYRLISLTNKILDAK